MMRRAGVVLAAVAVSLWVPLATMRAQQAPPAAGGFVPNELLISYRPTANAGRRDVIVAGQGAALVRRSRTLDIDHVRLAPGRDLAAALAALRAMPDVVAVQPNYVRRALRQEPNDPWWTFGFLWGLDRIQAPSVWSSLTTGDADVIVADIDTGVDYTHPDLAANMWTNPNEIPGNGFDDDNNGYVDDVFGIDAVNDDTDPMDDHGHGTHTAGTIAAVGNNSEGVVGVAWQASILACKILDAEGNGADADAVECFDYLVALRQRGVDVRVSSNSWGGPREGQPAAVLQAAIDAAGAAGILNVFAAGNDGTNNDVHPLDPASFDSPSIISVAASDENDGRASFSNYGATTVDLAAPGTNILSTVPDSYSFSSGTSMATPHVAGTAVLMLSRDPSLSVDSLKTLLMQNVDILPAWVGSVASGGRLNAAQATMAAGGNNPPIVSLTSPADGSAFPAPATVPLEATASDSDGAIDHVAFYANGTFIGADFSGPSPYAFTWTPALAGTYVLTAIATDDFGATRESVPVTVSVTPPAGRTNVAASANGGRATASSTLNGKYPARAVLDGDRLGLDWGSGGGWADKTVNQWPDWLQVDFNGLQTIEEIDVFTVQDDYDNPSDPTLGMTFTQWGIEDFSVEYWTGSDWQSVPGGSLTGNANVWRQFFFTPVTTTSIRVFITDAKAQSSRLTEVEAYAVLGSVNNPPTVTLTSPADGTTYVAPATVLLEATASDADGGVAQVDFYAGSTWLGTGEANGGLYTLTWATSLSGDHSLTAVATDDLGAMTTSTPAVISITAPPNRVNVALAGNGGTATASSELNAGYPAASVINGDRLGVNWGSGGGWADGTLSSWPDWMEVQFSGTQTIEEIDVFTVQDDYANPSDPTPSMTFSQWGVVDFAVEYWTGADWQPVPGGTVSGNDLVWRQFVFAPLTTSKIRVLVSDGLGFHSRLTEVEAYASPGTVNAPPSVSLTSPADGSTAPMGDPVALEATASDTDGSVVRVEFYVDGALTWTDTTSPYTATWTPAAAATYALTAVAIDDLGASATSPAVAVTVLPAGRFNAALAAYGGTAAASSELSGSYPASGVIDGDRRGLNWGSGGGWADGTLDTWPDWVEVQFVTAQTIDEIDVFTVQDDYQNPVDPTPQMTFTQWGIVDFSVEYWTGSAWQEVPGGTVVGNALVWRQFLFAPITTSAVRVSVSAGLANNSRVTELEAWTASGPGNTPPSVSMTSPADGASYTAGTVIGLAATASDADGTVTQVDFYANGTWLGTGAESAGTFTFAWPSSVGTHALTAVATDDDGATTTSAPVSVTVTPQAGGRVNVALATNGGAATASSQLNGKYPVSSVIDGDRRGLDWGNGGGWADKTRNRWPDWVEVAFDGLQTIDEIDVVTVQDDYQNPIEPTPDLLTTEWGILDFTVEYWTGSAWQPVPGGVVEANPLVWRRFFFAPVTTSRIRIFITDALGQNSRLTEVEAWTSGGSAP